MSLFEQYTHTAPAPIQHKCKRSSNIVYSRKYNTKKRKKNSSPVSLFSFLSLMVGFRLCCPPCGVSPSRPKQRREWQQYYQVRVPVFATIWLASLNSRLHPQVTKEHRIDMIPFGGQPRAPNPFLPLQGAFGRCCASR